MVGTINKALEDTICNEYGEEIWDAIKRQAKVTEATFISMDAYPDDITHRLVEAASQILDRPATEILEACGKHWTIFTIEEGYGELMAASGDTVAEFISNLDNLQARIGLSFPQLQPPSFQYQQKSDRTIILKYYSHREGLTSMLVGMLKGIGDRLNNPVKVSLLKSKISGEDCDEFCIEY
jgi:hypothetical protein